MRLNDGMPVWHASLTLWSPTGDRLRSPGVLERSAVALLAGVGGDREWWLWNPRARVAHLRVALTQDEADRLPANACPIAFDAGEAGPERRRNRASA